MAIINRIENTASIVYGGETVQSLPVETLLLLPPLIVKLVDKPLASINEELTYTITITNIGLTEITDLPFSDTIPLGTEYVVDSFEVDGEPQDPTFEEDTMEYTIDSIGIGETVTIEFRVLIVGGED